MIIDKKLNEAGGPAFPFQFDFGNEGQVSCVGMTLRDWFAGSEKAPDEISVDYAEALTGRAHPHKSTTLGRIDPKATIETIQFWADAQARYRYIMADAMLAARKAGEA